MIDRQLLRADPGRLVSALSRRDPELANTVMQLTDLDTKQRELKTEVERLQADRNRLSKEVGQKKASNEDASPLLKEVSEVSARVKALDVEAKETEERFLSLLSELPNLPDDHVPDGSDESANVEIRLWGEPRSDDVPAHWDIGESLGILDFEAGARLSGSRFTVLRGNGSRLARGLMQFMLDLHVDEHGYEEIWPPVIVQSDALFGTGQLPKFEEDLYHLGEGEGFLAPTAEVQLTNLYRDSIIDTDQLPIRHCAYTPCFRREAGSAGKDMRGMIRQHQFDKVELVQLIPFADRMAGLDSLTAHAEKVLQLLGLPYRVMELCTGDLGFSAEKTYDLEVWLPSQKQYREISSCSSFGQFQGRRAKIRHRKGKEKPEPVATINGSGLAIGRCIVALLENGWQQDGSVKMPEALQPYLGGLQLIK